MPRFSRRTNTPAICGRSLARPVSFSTIDASVSNSSVDCSGRSFVARCPGLGQRLVHRLRGAIEQRELAGASGVDVGLRQEAAFGMHAGPAQFVHDLDIAQPGDLILQLRVGDRAARSSRKFQPSTMVNLRWITSPSRRRSRSTRGVMPGSDRVFADLQATADLQRPGQRLPLQVVALVNALFAELAQHGIEAVAATRPAARARCWSSTSGRSAKAWVRCQNSRSRPRPRSSPPRTRASCVRA